MNCDQVFDILTRGPFPTGTACDEPVEAHLAQCADCRRLADALRPALELFQEAIGFEESRDLPGYHTATAIEREQPAVSHADRWETAPAASNSQSAAAANFSALAAWRLAAALALGVTLGTLLTARTGLRPDPGWITGGGAPALRSGDNESFARDRQALLARLSPACVSFVSSDGEATRQAKGSLQASAAIGSLHCCTDCHYAGTAVAPARAAAAVSLECRVCHID